MTTAYTSLLGLALPVTGELQGTWGDTVNNSITSLLDTAVAGTTTLSTDGDVTLTTTTGASNQARQAIILWTANGTVTRNITAPAQSKIYTVINASAGTQSIVFRGVGPTAGVTIVKGESALVAWNGSDFIKISNTGGAASFTNVTVSGTTTLSGLTASTALALNASKEVVSVTNTGTGNNVLSASPTLTGTIGAAALTLSSDLTLSAGTANGVAYLNGSKVLTTGSALTFDGTTFTAPGNIVSSGANPLFQGTSATGSVAMSNSTAGAYIRAYGASHATRANYTDFINGSSTSTFDSSGNLGLGVTPSAWGTGASVKGFQLPGVSLWGYGGTNAYLNANAYYNGTNRIYTGSGYATEYEQSGGNHVWKTAPSGTAGNTITFTQAMTLDASGNLLVGKTSSTGLGTQNFEIKNSSSATMMVSGGSYDWSLLVSSSADALRFYQGSTERARIDSSGRLLIGNTTSYDNATLSVTTPSQTFSVVADGGTTGNKSRGGFYHPSANVFALNADGGTSILAFTQNGTERARIDSSGNLLVAKTAAGVTNVGGEITSTGRIYSTLSTNNGTDTFTLYSTAAAAYRFYVVDQGTIYATSTTITAISDQRLKENIQDLDVGLDKIMALKPRKFDWKPGKGKDKKGDRGWIAQEFETVFPDLIDTWKDPAPEGEEPYKAVNADLIPVLVKAIQELNAKVDAQAAEIAALKSSN